MNFLLKRWILRELPNASTDGEVERGIIDGIVKLKQMGIHIPLEYL